MWHEEVKIKKKNDNPVRAFILGFIITLTIIWGSVYYILREFEDYFK